MSEANPQTKTIQDYRDIVRILKLKVMKQMNRIQQLEERVRFYQSQDSKVQTKEARFQIHAGAKKDSPVNNRINEVQKDFDYNNLKNKAIVMYLFQKGARKLGINLQGLFRYADVDYKNQIDSDFFRNLLSKMNLGLTLKQVSCLIFIFDEGCTGIITKKEYFSSLEAYQVCNQKSSKSYTQECLMKLSEIFEEKRIDVQKFFEEFSKSQAKLDLNSFQDAIKKKFNKALQDRQIIGAFNQIDFQSQGYVQRNNFIYSIRAYISKMKAAIAQSRIDPDSSLKNSQILINVRSKQSPSKSPLNKSPAQSNTFRMKETTKPPSLLREDKVLENMGIKSEQNKLESAKDGAISLQQILEDFTKEDLTLRGLYPSLLQFRFYRPMTLQMFSKIVRQLAPKAKHSSISHLFRLMDRNQKGTIRLEDLLQFFIRVDGDVDIIFRILARSFELDGLNTERFFFTNVLSETDEIGQEKFKEILFNRFGIDQNLFTGLWTYFDKQNIDRVHVSTIIKELSTYEIQ